MSIKNISVSVSEKKIEASELIAEIHDPGHGAQTVFLGVVRNNNIGKKVLAVSYDAFAPLTMHTFTEICTEALQKWGSDLKFAVFHRIGRLAVGEISVGIAVGSPHRDEAYQASRYVIEQLKIRSPIWKQEHYEGGDSEWLKGHALCEHKSK